MRTKISGSRRAPLRPTRLGDLALAEIEHHTSQALPHAAVTSTSRITARTCRRNHDRGGSDNGLIQV